MPMRESKTNQVGESGVSSVMSQFQDLGWGPVANKSHDLGTDIFVQVRERLFDIGVVLGVQVKTTDNPESEHGYLSRPKGDPESPEGWWYAEGTKDHFDHWATHALPHILVVRDHESGTSYWVHVTSDRVEDTGKGAKILVPASNTLDADHLGGLLDVAKTARSQVPFEGTAWTGGAAFAASTDLLRFALVAPRLVISPGRSSFTQQDELTPEEAVALMAQARFDRINHLRGSDDEFLGKRPAMIPSHAEAASSADWRWRFAAAIESRILDSDNRLLMAGLNAAKEPHQRAAAVVALTAALIETGHHAEAIDHLTRAIDADDQAPVDHAWLHAQRARAHLELGDLPSARADADRALIAGSVAPHDPTASAITGVSLTLIFNTASWEEKDYGSVIKGSDTAVSWWRNQMAATGLTALNQRVFKAWASDTSTTIGGSDDANNQLYVAALSAGHAGDHGAWRHYYTLLAQDTLLRVTNADPPDKVADALRMLRQAGAHKELKQALMRIANDGPCRAVTIAGDELDLERSTHTTIDADLALVSEVGDLLSQESAVRALRWLVQVYEDPAPLLRLTVGTAFDPRARVLEIILGLVEAIPDEVTEFVVRNLPEAELGEYALRINMWDRLLRSLPRSAWTLDRVERLLGGSLPPADHPLRLAILGICRHRSSEANVALLQELRAGSLAALISTNTVSDLDGESLHAVKARLIEAVDQIRADAANGTVKIGGLDPAYALGVIVLSHPDSEAANRLVDLVADPAVAGENKQGVLQLMARRAPDFRALVGDRLLEAADAAAASIGGETPTAFGVDVTGEAVFLVETLRGTEPESGMAFRRLVSGRPSQRMWAAHLAAQASGDQYISALLVLASDPDPHVRTQAAGGLTRLAVDGVGGGTVLEALRAAALDPGRGVPIAIAAQLRQAATLAPALQRLREALADHPSATVRAAASAG